MDILILIFFGILGLFLGSFFNHVIYRSELRWISTRKNTETWRFWHRRSICPKCKHKLGFWDLIPVFSFIFLGGKCRYCRQNISWQYPIVELTTAGLFIFVAWHHLIFNFQFSIFNFLILIQDLFFVSILLLLFIFDLKYKIIPDRISIPAITLSVIFGTFSVPIVGSLFFHNILKLILAMVIGGGFFLVQYLISKGKWIGGGDIRLGILMGAMLSWPNILLALFLAYVAGAIYGIIAIISKKKTLKSAVPFGIFLTAATFVNLFYGTQIISWYVELLGY